MMKSAMAAIAMLVLAGVAPSIAAKPAFDCSKAETEIDTLICQHGTLGEKDQTLAEVYRQALASLAGVADKDAAIKFLTDEQRGWVKGRNDCWKANDKIACTAMLYDRRIAELQARYFLIEAGDPVFYTCNGNPSDEIVATFVSTDPPSVRLERGDTMKVAVLSPSGSGAKYVADSGVTFWTKGDGAQVNWPEGNDFTCVVRN